MKAPRTFKEILIESFLDDRGNIDGKMITMFFSFAMLMWSALLYQVTSWRYGEENAVELPDVMWGTFAGIVVSVITASTVAFREATKVDRTRIIEEHRPDTDCAPEYMPIDTLREKNKHINGGLSTERATEFKDEMLEDKPGNYL